MMRHQKFALLALAGTSLTLLPGIALAQDAAPPPPLDRNTAVVGDAGTDSDIVILGSRIPRQTGDGPAPVITITSDSILRNGYQSVPDVLRALSMNGGETQSQQSYSGASFTPGAQQVDLRGLGPNHTLVLVNGRRIADFPLPFNGNSNFTDISNIPVGLIDRVEVLSGSASAIYGSDAIAGVINFQLKSRPDGTRIDYRFGATEQGGGSSHRLSITSGWDTGKFHGVVGLELLDQRPLWQYQRGIQDSTTDDPVGTPLARRTFLRTDEIFYYIDPGKATCDPLSYLNHGTTYYAARAGRDTIGDGPGYFCGSDASVAYGTILSERKSASGFGSMGYTLSDKAELFADFQASYSSLKLLRDVQSWYYVSPDGNEDGTFYNPKYLTPEQTYYGDQLDNWTRQFTPEEMGGLQAGMIRNRSTAFNITPGIRGHFGKDDKYRYELSFNHGQYSSWVSFPEVVIDKANAFFLGPQVGDGIDGYAQFDADPTRLYTPLTPAEYRSITASSIYRPKSWVNNVALSLNTTELFRLPGGAVGAALSAEAGNQGYDLKPDPLALTQYYVGLIDSDGKGTRQHWGVAGEMRLPVASFFEADVAGRYDHYNVAGNSFGRFTYNLGAVVRPTSRLMLRAAYGTGFRAPDLNYVFRGPGNTHPAATDYYLCRSLEPDEDINDCSRADEGIISHRQGNRQLRPETSTSLNAGLAWRPSSRFDVSLSYFRVAMKNEVLDINIDTLLRTEADCRLGETVAGTPVASSAPTCVDAIDRVQRYTSGAREGELEGVYINPINVAQETTNGFDFAAHIRLPTRRIGIFSLAANYTYVLHHTIRQYPGDPVVNELAYDSGYDIPRDKGSASLTWELNRFSTTLTGQRLGKLPNYAENGYIKASYLFNLSAQYSLTDRFRLSGTINNLFGQNPIRDATYSAYPYYDISWFDAVGRSFYAQISYKLGGTKL